MYKTLIKAILENLFKRYNPFTRTLLYIYTQTNILGLEKYNINKKLHKLESKNKICFENITSTQLGTLLCTLIMYLLAIGNLIKKHHLNLKWIHFTII